MFNMIYIIPTDKIDTQKRDLTMSVLFSVFKRGFWSVSFSSMSFLSSLWMYLHEMTVINATPINTIVPICFSPEFGFVCDAYHLDTILP